MQDHDTSIEDGRASSHLDQFVLQSRLQKSITISQLGSIPRLHSGLEDEPLVSRTVTMPGVLANHKSLLSDNECLMALSSAPFGQDLFIEHGLSSASLTASDESTNRLLLHGMVCVVLVLVNANDTLLKSISQQKASVGEKYSPSSVMLASNVISVLFGNVLCALRPEDQDESFDTSDCLERIQNFWTGSQLFHMSLPAAFFTLSGTLKFIALGLVPPGVVMTLEQSTVLLCALMGWAWLGKRYSVAQLVMLLQVTLGFLWYQNCEHKAIGASQQGASELLSHYWAGVALMCGSVVTVTAGGLSCEKLLKGPSDRPFYVQKAQMEFSMAVSGLLFGFVLQPLLQGSSPLLKHGFFHGWDRQVVLVLVLHTCKSWLATTTVRILDNLTFTLACNAAMLLVYLERLLFLDGNHGESFKLDVFSALSCTALGAAGFAAASAWRRVEASKGGLPPGKHRLHPANGRSPAEELQKPLLSRRKRKMSTS